MGFTYEALAFHLSDSQSMIAFAKFNYPQKPSKSSLQGNIKSISKDAWEVIHNTGHYGMNNKIDSGNTTRKDATAVNINIHKPSDSTLLQDGIRVITRTVHKAKELCPDLKFSDHNRAAKKRVLNIMHYTWKGWAGFKQYVWSSVVGFNLQVLASSE